MAGQLLALAQGAAEAHVARLRAAAGEQEIAEAGQPHQGLRPRAQRLAEAPHLGEAAGDERGMGAGAQRLALDDAGGDGQHVLDGAAELHADRVRRAVDPERPAAQRLGQAHAQRLVGAGQGQRRRQPAHHVGGEARPRQDGERRLRQALAQHLGQQLAGGLLQALGADDDRLARRQMRRQRGTRGAHVLRRGHHEHDVAGGDIGQLGCRPQGRSRA